MVCKHCGDPIGTNPRGEWVDENALTSCAPIAPVHEPKGSV